MDVCIGDSITAGLMTDTFPPWCARLDPPGDNGAIGLTTMQFWAFRPNLWLSMTDPGDRVLLMLGTNDATLGTQAVYPVRLATILDDMGGAGLTVQVIHTPWRGVGTPGISRAQLNIDYREQRNFDLVACDARGWVECGPDMYALTEERPELFQDGLHYNVAGHELQATMVPEASTFLLALAALGTIAALANRSGIKALWARVRRGSW